MNCRCCGVTQEICTALAPGHCCTRCETGKTMHHEWGRRNPAVPDHWLYPHSETRNPPLNPTDQAQGATCPCPWCRGVAPLERKDTTT